jgi:hypothetical protein
VASLLARVLSNKEHTTRIAVIPCPGARSAIVRLQRRCVALDRLLVSTAAEHETTTPDRRLESIHAGISPRKLPVQAVYPVLAKVACLISSDQGWLCGSVQQRIAFELRLTLDFFQLHK